jgi:putative methyltransferase (TIGR04325 family)
MDFGGGLGISYLCLKAALQHSDAIDYTVIENRTICEMGKQIFEHDPHIRFCSELPSETDADIVYVCSALQYVDDYRGLLNRLCAYTAQYVFLGKTSAGDIPTYATAQMNVEGSIIPFWFLNIDELTQVLASAGYSLIFSNVLEREYPQENLPESHRLKHACNLVFARND